MAFSDCLSSAGSKTSALSRRELLGKSFAVAVAAVAKRSAALSVSKSYPLPNFNIGDLVADHWIDEFNDECVEHGEVCGICWHPDEQVWAYLVSWTSGGMPMDCYPCFDGYLLTGGDLRLVRAG